MGRRANSYTLDNDPMRQGNKAFEAGDFDRAQQYFNEAVTNSYHLPEALLGLARIDLYRGADQDAEPHSRQALAAGGDASAAAQAYLGIALWRQGRTDEAAQAFTVALDQDPKLWEAHYGMALKDIAAGLWGARPRPSSPRAKTAAACPKAKTFTSTGWP